MHELGHFETARLFKFNIDKIYLYPTGGISKFSTELNIPLYKDFFVLINGPLLQCITYYIITKVYPYSSSIEHLKLIHYSIILFNMLPIYPLDGGKLLNIVFNIFFSYKNSLKYSIYFSYILLILFSFYIPMYFKLNYIIMIIFLFTKVTSEKKNIKYYFDKFMLERYLYSHSFYNFNIIQSLDKMRRGYNHIIRKKEVYFEEEILNSLFLNKK